MSYKIEMHAHTSQVSPCGQLSAEELIQIYSQADYSGIVIADHLKLGYTVSDQDDTEMQLQKFLAGYYAAAEAGEKAGMKVYLGAEISFVQTPDLEFLLYGVTPDFLRKSLAYLPGKLEDFYPFAHKNDVLVFCAHPFRYTDYPPNPAFIDGAETYNLHPGHNSRNDLGLRYALENNLMQVSGSDTHHQTHALRGGIITDVLPDDVFALRDLLLSGNYTLITGVEQ